MKNWSPFNYCFGNPVRFEDKDGAIPIETIWDVGNVLYDIGSGIYHEIAGNREEANSAWGDLAMDAAAMLIPYVPAGASKIVKGAKAVDKAVDAARAADNATDAAKVVDKGTDAKKNVGRSKNKLEPNKQADGDHSSFKKDSDGNTTNYETYEQNSQNPSGYDTKKRYDGQGKGHYDKKTGEVVETPHVHENGKIRKPNENEIPKQSN